MKYASTTLYIGSDIYVSLYIMSKRIECFPFFKKSGLLGLSGASFRRDLVPHDASVDKTQLCRGHPPSS